MPEFPAFRIPTFAAVLTCAALACAGPSGAAAQQTGSPPPAAPPATPPGVVATTDNPNLAVATIKLEQGSRLSQLIGMSVHPSQNLQSPQLGKIDDLIMTGDSKVTMAVIAVGGFLGLGAKLVAVPWSQLQMQPDASRLILPGATVDMLNGMPTFTY